MSRLPLGLRFSGSSPRVRQRGFSLLELIAVIVLIAIVITVASVNASKSLGSARTRAVSRDLVAALRYTRGQAIVHGEQRTFDVDLEHMRYQAPGRESVAFPDGIEVRVLTAANEVSPDRVARVRFFPDGSSSGGRLSVVAGDRQWRVNIEWLTGEVALDEVQR